MLLPNGELAEVDIRKLRDYCLNLDHEYARDKARVFDLVLGLKVEHSQLLKARLLEIVLNHEAVSGRFDEFGQRYTVDFGMTHNDRTAIIRSAWIIDIGSDIPRLATCYIPKRKK